MNPFFFQFPNTGPPVDVPDDATTADRWASVNDLRRYYPALDQLQFVALAGMGGDSEGFPEVIALATDSVRRDMAARYRPDRGQARRRLATTDPAQMTARDARLYAICGDQDVPDPSVVLPTVAQFGAWLAGGGLVLDRPIREAVARRAIALVLDRESTSGGANTYDEERDRQLDEAAKILDGYEASFDADGDGVADWLVRRGMMRVVKLTGGA